MGLKEGNAPFKFTVSRGRDDYEATFPHTQTMPAGMGIAIDFCKTSAQIVQINVIVNQTEIESTVKSD